MLITDAKIPKVVFHYYLRPTASVSGKCGIWQTKPPDAESADGVDFRRVNKRIIENLFTKIVFFTPPINFSLFIIRFYYLHTTKKHPDSSERLYHLNRLRRAVIAPRQAREPPVEMQPAKLRRLHHRSELISI